MREAEILSSRHLYLPDVLTDKSPGKEMYSRAHGSEFALPD
jgi:hypothetical protein